MSEQQPEVPQAAEEELNDVVASVEVTESGSAGEEGQGGGSRLDEEGDAAADYLEELLDIADLDGDIDIEVRGGRVYVSISSEESDEDLSALVGRDGRTLEALQELSRLAVLAGTGQRSRFVLDINGYREERTDELKSVAEEAIAAAKETGEPQELEPMSPYERKQVHDLVAEAGLTSDSAGEGPRRHVVIHPSED